ncbi:MAG: ASKHA domain-containing protein, partial [Spirochaetes bacterium]|nr:ASKHA domain-containing protein [Spirochaetota bacterium]
TVTAAPGASLRDALHQAGIALDYPCGGKGSCRQCRVTIDPAPSSGMGTLPEEETAKGVRLTCQTAVEMDCTVTVEEERLSRRTWKLGTRGEDVRVPADIGSFRRVPVALAEPGLEDQRPDWERLSSRLEDLGIRSALPDPSSLEDLGTRLRASGWKVEAICEEDAFLWIAGAEHACGFAIDLGTTTVDLALVDLENGGLLGRRAFLNRQVSFGADVVTRAQAFHADRSPVRRAALETIEEGAHALLAEAGAVPSRVLKTVIVGNPIMLHILNGIDPWQLTLVPYVPATASPLRSRAQEFGWTFQERGYVETLPLISAYVGADTIGMIVSLGLEEETKTTLSIDIGTNGEMVLARHGELITTSTAAGPAFEGAEISCGMRALDGAVTGVTFDAEGTPRCTVVGGGHPRGICGTGLVSAVAALLDRGVIDATGRLVDREELPDEAARARLFAHDGEAAFALSDDRRVFISQGDVRKLQLAKGAVRTGIETLLEVTGVAKDGLDTVRLAGNFGAGLDARAAMRIGLIPALDPARVEVVGNAALRGAVLVLLSRGHGRMAERAARKARFVELGGKPEFQARFAEAMMF